MKPYFFRQFIFKSYFDRQGGGVVDPWITVLPLQFGLLLEVYL